MDALSPSVDLVILDEPTSALDAQGERHVLQNMLQRRKGLTMICVTHRFGLLTKAADRIL